MRKVGSAPSLINFGQSQQERHEPSQCAQRVPKSGSTSSLTKLSTSNTLQKDGGRRQAPVRSRETRTRAFPLAALDILVSTPPDPAVTEEFAESARGLAGLECFELYGPQVDAPAVQPRGAESQEEIEQQYNRKAAFASCLATPLTGEDKNLGELVDAEARAMLQSAQEDIAARYEQEVSSQATALTEVTSPERDLLIRSRKRRLAEKFGFGGREKRSSIDLFDDCPEAQQMLSNLASMDDATNRALLHESSEDSWDTSFPVKKADDGIFDGQHLFKPPPAETKLPISRSV